MGIAPATLARNAAIESKIAFSVSLIDDAARMFGSDHRLLATQRMYEAIGQLTAASHALNRLTPRTNLFSEAVHNWTTHAVRDANDALQSVSRRGTMSLDSRTFVADAIRDARQSARMAADAASRSLAAPRLHAPPAWNGSSGAVPAPHGPVVLDGQLIDNMGNPTSWIRNGNGPDDIVSEFPSRIGQESSFDIPSGIFLG